MIVRIRWIDGSVNDCIEDYCDRNGIDWRYNRELLELCINDVWMVPCHYVDNDIITLVA